MSFSPIPIHKLSLQRYPATQDKSLRAWNAADELLLEHIQGKLTELSLDSARYNCLIINDQFGVLSASLNALSPVYWTDSFLSQQAIKRNLQNNFSSSNFNDEIKATQLVTDDHVADDHITNHQPLNNDLITNKTDNQLAETNRYFDLVLIRIPKHNSLLEFQLNRIKPWINNKTKIIAGGMTKEIHNSNIKLFETILGKTTTSLAKKKARLIFTQFENSRSSDSSDSSDNSDTKPIQFKCYNLPQYQISACGLPGVFSRDKLDIGTQVLLKYLPEVNQGEEVIDLGCGNGVIGAIIAKRQPGCHVLLSDESQLAVASAKLTFTNNQLANGRFVHTDVLQNITRNHFDHILCNPPFHQQNVQTLAIAQNMFKQSAQCLKSTGELRVVANRHLKYLPMLKRYFGEVSSISKDNKFTVWLAKSPKK